MVDFNCYIVEFFTHISIMTKITKKSVGFWLLIRFSKIIPSKLFLKWKYRLYMDKKLNINNPITYNEKLQWLKIHDRNPLHTQLVDKYAVKQYVSDHIGKDYVIPTIAVFNNVNDIEWEKLPNQFVLKCTHDSGGLIVCSDKSKLDIKKVKKKLKKSLRRNYYWFGREWPYRNVPPRIICEKYMVDESGYELKDYKWFCFDGIPKALFIASDRNVAGKETKFDFFDMDFHHLPFRQGHPNADVCPTKPRGFEEMKHLAQQLSKGIPHVRIDFYDVNGHIYFGEFTFFHYGGMTPFNPEEWDKIFGDWITLPQTN